MVQGAARLDLEAVRRGALHASPDEQQRCSGTHCVLTGPLTGVTRVLKAYRLGYSHGLVGYPQVRKSYAELFVWSWKTKQPQIRFHNLETAPLHVYRFLNHA